jgi:hypothetical protein
MKTSFRPLVAGIFFAVLCAASLAADPKPAAEDKNPAGCDCGKDKDGKVCGVDKDCCCTGQKATKPASKSEKKDEKKPEKNDGKH